ncbi:conserved protein of unknown function [Micropruina glycogenica]|uniref:Uncharacterized protein n=1 Tax=Micropruina glycogenica TaxID=75385 RepID=A0A2N9JKT7_9ACTN|nr:conserved protein of unknown function [Micropruina glycogenica]
MLAGAVVLGTAACRGPARAGGRRFPGLLIQGDTLACFALKTARSWLADYEAMMREVGLELPYGRPVVDDGEK